MKANKIIVFDIDGTLLNAAQGSIHIYKRMADGSEMALTPSQYTEEAASKGSEGSGITYDFRDFSDESKVYESIVKGSPIVGNLRIMDKALEEGFDFCFLTARACKDTVAWALDDFLLWRHEDGTMHRLGARFRKDLSVAVNDAGCGCEEESDAEKKAGVLKRLCACYRNVTFVDDDARNIDAARSIGLPNLNVIQARQAG